MSDSDQTAFEAVRAGGRAHVELSMFKEEIACPKDSHHWRTIVCRNDQDIVECAHCGRQRITACNFDDDYN